MGIGVFAFPCVRRRHGSKNEGGAPETSVVMNGPGPDVLVCAPDVIRGRIAVVADASEGNNSGGVRKFCVEGEVSAPGGEREAGGRKLDGGRRLRAARRRRHGGGEEGLEVG